MLNQELPPSMVSRTVDPSPTMKPRWPPAKNFTSKSLMDEGSERAVVGPHPPEVFRSTVPDVPTIHPLFGSIMAMDIRLPEGGGVIVSEVQELPPSLVRNTEPPPTTQPVRSLIKETPERLNAVGLS